MTRQPDFRDDFWSDSDELNYLNDLICFSLQSESTHSKELEAALRRFHHILARNGLDDGSIMLQDHWALLHEARGARAEAIEHREREVEFIERLFSMGGPVGPINRHFLIRVLQSLRLDYLHVGDTEKASAALQRVEDLKKGRGRIEGSDRQ